MGGMCKREFFLMFSTVRISSFLSFKNCYGLVLKLRGIVNLKKSKEFSHPDKMAPPLMSSLTA